MVIGKKILKVFGVDKICLHWKEFALPISTSKEEDGVFRFTVTKERLILGAPGWHS